MTLGDRMMYTTAAVIALMLAFAIASGLLAMWPALQELVGP
jgi:cell division protein FtsL